VNHFLSLSKGVLELRLIKNFMLDRLELTTNYSAWSLKTILRQIPKETSTMIWGVFMTRESNCIQGIRILDRILMILSYDLFLNIYSPLEIIYDRRTFRQMLTIFKTPDEINLSNLQQSAFAKFKEYKESTALTLQYAIDTHNLIDVEIFLMSSYIVVPHSGTFTESCACTVANLGSLSVKSKPISAETRYF